MRKFYFVINNIMMMTDGQSLVFVVDPYWHPKFLSHEASSIFDIFHIVEIFDLNLMFPEIVTH